MKNKSQTQKILKYLLAGNSITPLSALRLFGCTRLASRICEAKKILSNLTVFDYKIHDKWITHKGKTYKKYWLE